MTTLVKNWLRAAEEIWAFQIHLIGRKGADFWWPSKPSLDEICSILGVKQDVNMEM